MTPTRNDAILSRCSLGLAMLLGLGVSGCYAKARDEAQARASRLEREKSQLDAELTRERQASAEARANAERLTTQLRSLEAENQRLRQTPRFYFDRAVDAERQAQTANTDAADRAAIEAFREVATRYPEDALARVSSTRVAALERRITERAAALRAAQASVVRLIATCRRETLAARAAERNSLRFDMFQQLDMNSAMAGNRRAEAHDRAARSARERATELLRQVPDPDNALRDQLQRCDQSDE